MLRGPGAVLLSYSDRHEVSSHQRCPLLHTVPILVRVAHVGTESGLALFSWVDLSVIQSLVQVPGPGTQA